MSDEWISLIALSLVIACMKHCKEPLYVSIHFEHCVIPESVHFEICRLLARFTQFCRFARKADPAFVSKIDTPGLSGSWPSKT